MTLFYSKTTNGFYDTGFADYDLPTDVVEITKEQHASLMKAQSDGKEIMADENGNPIAQEHVPTDEEKKQALERSAANAIALTDRVAARCLKAGISFPAEWLAYYRSVLKIYNGTDTESTKLPEKPDFPENS